MVQLEDHLFEQGPHHRGNFTNYYFGNEQKFNKFIYSLVAMAGDIRKKYGLVLFDAFCNASEAAFKAAERVRAKKKKFSTESRGQAAGLLSIAPQLNRSLAWKTSPINRGRAKHFIIKHMLYKFIKVKYNRDIAAGSAEIGSVDNQRGEEEFFRSSMPIRDYAIQKRNIELRAGQNAFIFNIPKKK
jgi:hypothetical protein